ncbi:MAG: carboxypeptidase M32 [Desulfomonilaceae bacterium]|nr:carboxypeptidase M32 [Desulfomonilaceae bacterium]
MNALQAYKDLMSRSREIAHLDSAMELAYWDQRTNIPARGHAHRVRHLAAMAKMRYRRLTDPRIGDLLSTVEDSSLIDDRFGVVSVNVREVRRVYDRLKRVPAKLATDIVRAGAEAEAAWEKACPKNDWPRLRPFMERLAAMKREEAELLGYENEPYDALLGEYEPEETARSIEALLGPLSAALVRLLERIDYGRSNRMTAPTTTRVSVPDQEHFATEVARKLGYRLESGRIDISSHPFATGLGPGDVRITSRYNETDLREGLFGVVHEVGHALYVQGLPTEHWGEPICHVASLSIDESQSLIWEFFVARSNGFWNHLLPDLMAAFPHLKALSHEDVVRWINQVNPASLRVNADEVTYNLHIVLRFELERDLINRVLEVKDLPAAWIEKSHKYLGHRPTDHRGGVMQDVHWPSGLFGYFPGYTLGHVYAAQFFHRAKEELGDLDEQFSRGEFSHLRGWLRHRIHSAGATFRPHDLIRRVTGEGINPLILVEYLETKYEGLYGV